MNGFALLFANAALFYPVYWIAMFIVRAGPVLAHVVFNGHQLVTLEPGLLWVEAACRIPGGGAAHATGSTPVEFLIVFGAAAIAFLSLRRHAAIAGIFIAALGQVALTGQLFGWRRGALFVAAVSLYLAVVLVGLALLASSIGGGYWKRFTAIVLAFCLPLAVFSSFYMRLGADWQIIPMFAGPALLLAAVAALWNKSHAATPTGWPLRRLALGLAASLVLVGGVQAAQMARDRFHRVFLAAIPKPAPAPYAKLFFQRGVNFTAEGRAGYDPRFSVHLLDRLKSYGVDSIALVPYGFADSREPTIRFGGASMERTEDIEALTALAHQRNMKVLLKPQLWTRDGFPGILEFADPPRRARWFVEYRKFLEYYATAASRMHADLFSVGVELGKMTPYEGEWRALIARARELYPGPLVYSATQGPEFETIRFWDALDYIGLNEYYPLPDDLSTAGIVRTVEAVQKKYARPVIFTEAGFSTYAHPNRAPWDETPRALAPADQARCYEAVFKAFYTKPWFEGVYWWKVGTDGFGGSADGSHTPWGKQAMDVVGKWYRSGER